MILKPSVVMMLGDLRMSIDPKRKRKPEDVLEGAIRRGLQNF